ncbi:MAG TPA: hypothetical protein VK277_13415 [Acidimicrobiales bacterium]|nr:hypothetical protein [Acidimicrobiales bacterium]
MPTGQWRVTEVRVEESFGGDLLGHGDLQLEDGCLHLRVRPRGLSGIVVPTREHRRYPVAGVRGWEVKGDRVAFTAGLLMTTFVPGSLAGWDIAEAPVHVCHLRCADESAAGSLTDAVVAAGLPSDRVSHRRPRAGPAAG